MNERKWTKGPWGVCSNVFGGAGVKPSGDSRLLLLLTQQFPDQNPANAHLIAASPELYEALEESNRVIHDLARSYVLTHDNADERAFFPLYGRITAALAKARGEA